MKSKRDRARTSNPINKIQKLATLPRVYLYISVMAIVGMAVGEVNYRVENKSCSTDDSCWAIEPARRRLRNLGLGMTAGIFAATVISFPALLEND
ncbi:MAG: hypothetical protein AAGE96_19045 [Cyanobacteria bacterium P01_G01_bin.19]